MPYQVSKQGDGFVIQKKTAGGKLKTVGHSSSRTKAQKSVNARNAAAHGAKLGRKR